MSKRKICVVVASRANYGRVKSLMMAIKNHPALELQLIVGASVMLYRFGKALDVILADGFVPDRKIHCVVEGETLTTQAKSTGMGILDMATALEDLQPDAVVTVADRFETMATAIAASYLHIPLIHLQGGELSGNIDEKVRHAVTKLADIHFPATDQSRERLIRMGENPECIFNYGCPGMDTLKSQSTDLDPERMKTYGGVGRVIDWSRPYILMMQHPVTTSYGEGFEQVNKTLEALKALSEYQKVVLWPNIDAGSDDVAKGLRVFRERNPEEPFHFFRNFSPEDYACVLANAQCAVGNSSSFIREGAFLGVPAVIIGDRQEAREHGENVVFADYDTHDIVAKIRQQLDHAVYEHNDLFGSGNTGERIADTIATVPISPIKRMTY